jgi:hypothetical protein
MYIYTSSQKKKKKKKKKKAKGDARGFSPKLKTVTSFDHNRLKQLKEIKSIVQKKKKKKRRQLPRNRKHKRTMEKQLLKIVM